MQDNNEYRNTSERRNFNVVIYKLSINKQNYNLYRFFLLSKTQVTTPKAECP
jgi:hypothetical protein